MGELMSMFSHGFIIRALVVGGLISLCAALLGVNLVLKRYSMIGDGLSHVGFGALALSAALGLAPLAVSLPVVMAAAVLLLRLGERGEVRGDAAIAIVSSSAVAFGVVITALSSGNNIDVYNYLFGSILAVSRGDVVLSIVVSAIVLSLFIVFYNKLFAVTFDEGFARASGTRAGRYNLLLALLTAMVIVVGMRLMGSMLISSLIIFPALSSMRLCKTFRGVVVLSAAVSVLCLFFGMLASFVFSLPTGACIVLANLAVFCIFSLARALRKKAGA